jgi:hypothetical protein
MAVVCVGLVLGSGTSAQSDPTEKDGWGARVAELEQAYVGVFAQLLRWCRGKKLFRTADVVARELLQLAPDHEKARRWLGYTRRRGEWVPPKRPKKRRDWSPDAASSYPVRRAALLEELALQYEGLLEDLEFAQEATLRARVLELVLERWPHRAAFHAMNGEVRWRDRWVFPETPAAKKSQMQLMEDSSSLLEAAPDPQSCQVPEYATNFNLPWKGAFTSERVTVVSAGSAEEASRVARRCEVAERFFQSVFGVERSYPDRVIILLGRDPLDGASVANRLLVSDRDRRRLLQAQGYWIPTLTPTLFLSSPTEAERLDSALHFLFGLLVRRTFGDFGRLGWVDEGIVTYLTWLSCGTRLTTLVTVRAATDARYDGKVAPAKFSDLWLHRARAHARQGTLPDLVYVLAVDLNTMTIADRLAAYAFAVYLVSARPGEAAAFLWATEEGRLVAQAAHDVMGLELPDLNRRWQRWVRDLP